MVACAILGQSEFRVVEASHAKLGQSKLKGDEALKRLCMRDRISFGFGAELHLGSGQTRKTYRTKCKIKIIILIATSAKLGQSEWLLVPNWVNPNLGL